MKGTTLLETVIALGIMALVILVFAEGLRAGSTTERRARMVAEVESQAGATMYQIAQSIRNSRLITSPATSSTATSLTLVSNVSAENPTVISLASTSVMRSLAGGTAAPLSTTDVRVTAISFQNVSTTSARAVRVSFTMMASNPTRNPIFDYSNTFITTVTLR